jgi:hypothetical protein
VLRRRDPADGPGDITEWDGTVRLGGDERREVGVNRYFAAHHPDRVIGLTGTRSGQFGPELDVTVVGQIDVAGALRARLADSLHDAAGGDPAWSLFAAPPANTPFANLAPAALAGEYTQHQQEVVLFRLPSFGFEVESDSAHCERPALVRP